MTRLKTGVELTLFEGRRTRVTAGLPLPEVDAPIPLVKVRYPRGAGLDPQLEPVYKHLDRTIWGTRPN